LTQSIDLTFTQLLCIIILEVIEFPEIVESGFGLWSNIITYHSHGNIYRLVANGLTSSKHLKNNARIRCGEIFNMTPSQNKLNPMLLEHSIAEEH
jgi:hypothetical protein